MRPEATTGCSPGTGPESSCRALVPAALAAFFSDGASCIHVLSTLELERHFFTAEYGTWEVGQWPNEMFTGEKTEGPRARIKTNQIPIYHCRSNSAVWLYHACCSRSQCLNPPQKKRSVPLQTPPLPSKGGKSWLPIHAEIKASICKVQFYSRITAGA